jgi:hypothetical protein
VQIGTWEFFWGGRRGENFNSTLVGDWVRCGVGNPQVVAKTIDSLVFFLMGDLYSRYL